MRKHHSRVGTAGSREREQPGKERRTHSEGDRCREELVDAQERENVCPEDRRPQTSKADPLGDADGLLTLSFSRLEDKAVFLSCDQRTGRFIVYKMNMNLVCLVCCFLVCFFFFLHTEFMPWVVYWFCKQSRLFLCSMNYLKRRSSLNDILPY